MRFVAVVVIGGLGLPACATVTAESAFAREGLARAAFDLQCPAEQVTSTVLTRNDGLGCLGSVMGVRGCGKQTTYVCNDSQTWVRDAEVSALEGP